MHKRKDTSSTWQWREKRLLHNKGVLIMCCVQRTDIEGGEIPKHAWKELRCIRHRITGESYYMTWRHEVMVVWAFAMFKRDWKVKSNNRSGWRWEWSSGITNTWAGLIGLLRCVEVKPGDGEITKISTPLHGSKISPKPLTLIFIGLWDVSAHDTRRGLKCARIVRLAPLFLPFTKKTFPR